MHINLILDTEARSASPVPLNVLIRIIAGALVMLVLLALFSFYSSYRGVQQEVNFAKDDWRKTGPKYEAAIHRRTELAQKNAILKEIGGWRASRLEWGRQLEGLRTAMPDPIQLTELRVSQVVLAGSNNVPARAFEMRLSGRTPAAQAEENVNDLRQALLSKPAFTQCVEAVTIPAGAFRQDPQGKNDRVFELVCKYAQRRFE